MKSIVRHHSKRWWIIVGVVAFIVVSVGVYSIYSVTSWNSYQQRTQVWKSTTKQTITTVLSLKSTSDDQRQRKLAAMNAAVVSIRKSQTYMCAPARLTGWQLTFAGARHMRGVCGDYSEKIGQTVEQLSHATGYLESEAQIVGIMRPALTLPSSVNEANWQQTATIWGQVHKNMNDSSVSPSFATTKQQAVSATAAVEANWKELIAAHTAKDKSRFLASTAKLQEAYTSLSGLTTVNDGQLALLTTRLQQLYSAL